MNNDPQAPIQESQPPVPETPSPSSATLQERSDTNPNKRVLLVVIICAGILLFAASIIITWLLLTKNASQTPTGQTNSTASNSPQSDATTSQNSATSPATSAIRARDTERKTDIDSILNQAEAYYANFGGYPALSDINNSAWRTANQFSAGASEKWLADPLTPTILSLSGTVPSSSTGSYTYIALPAKCQSMTSATGKEIATTNACTSFKLVALLENKDDREKNPSSTSTQTFYIKTDANN